MGRIKGPLLSKGDPIVFKQGKENVCAGIEGFLLSPDAVWHEDEFVEVVIQKPGRPPIVVDAIAVELKFRVNGSLDAITYPEDGYDGTYSWREEHKRAGWELVNKPDATSEDMAYGANMICKSHWYRSEGLHAYNRKLIPFEEYRLHWCVSILKGFDKDTKLASAAKHMVEVENLSLPSFGKIKPGHTDWE